MKVDRLPPNNIDAEEALLGSIIMDSSVLDDIHLSPRSFYREINGWVFDAMLSLRESGSELDLITISDTLRKRGQLEEMGGEGYIIGLVQTVPTSINAREYADIVKDTATRRELISRASTVASLAYDEEGDLSAQIGLAEASLNDLSTSQDVDNIKVGQVISADYLDHLEKAMSADGTIHGVETGILELDMLNGGLEKPQMHIVAARPAMGKSSFVIGIAEHLALNLGKTVLFLSMEMTSSQIMNRIIAKRTGIGLRKLRSAKGISEREWRAIHSVISDVSSSGLIIDETVNIKPSVVRSKTSRLHSKNPVDVIIYDHLHLMGSDKYGGNPVKEVGENSKQIFNIGKELGVPSIVAAQLSRKVEERRDKRPVLSDLRESGEIEQNAYSVIFLYRDDYYYGSESERVGLAEATVAKYRDGSTGTIEMLWQKHTASFMNIRRQSVSV